MGSLMPGWDGSALNVEKEFDEVQEMEEPKGYFAKLERARSKRTQPGVESLPSATSFGRDSLTHTSTLGRTSLPLSPSMSRASVPVMGPHTDGVAHVSLDKISNPLGRSSLNSKKYQMTDWSQEFKALGGHKPMESLSSHSKKEEVQHDAWWSHLDAGALNCAPDVPADKNSKGFRPQFDVLGQRLQFRSDGGADDTGAGKV
mmetsp:Transcript_9254/g.19787  ORF Transcript_9254/g.19787 Transcript_9254/m.19787 type:complete len:202 (+) Transcript_9254:163-768(+)|eukprot:CAMPEP_0202900110 /NCGR_PEP_ID=MMETSP1392-20130828/9841_1 /ASSEMBLY_ACC=CAM_ASM_000868 /TAXON_ID=225041 /ORGANISM="Chlamydomonas chlamydogama, Strain SAG 11-48b" /LENGTH=201 /DNA_ID=CAMNT_0049586427 /DNA_START=163 /DNA_END=768 /DNA_ORIENTATION=+